MKKKKQSEEMKYTSGKKINKKHVMELRTKSTKKKDVIDNQKKKKTEISLEIEQVVAKTKNTVQTNGKKKQRLSKYNKLPCYYCTNYKPFFCHICSDNFASVTSVLAHIKGHGENESNGFKCKICNDEFDDIYKMQIHLAKISLEIEAVLAKTKNTVQTNDKKKQRISKYYNKLPCYFCANDKPFCCHICGDNFASVTSVLAHIKDHGENESNGFKCKICNDEFDDIYKMQIHLVTCQTVDNKEQSGIIEVKCHKSSLDLGDNGCTTCLYTFPTYHQLLSHVTFSHIV